MTGNTLELISSHGDQTLPGLRYVIYGTGTAGEEVDSMVSGLRFAEGYASATTNLIHALDRAVKPGNPAESSPPGRSGRIIAVASPAEYSVGYAAFTSASVDRSKKKVTGNPLAYASARNQLSWYLDSNPETARARIEGEVDAGYTIQHRPSFVVEPKYLIGGWRPTEALAVILSRLEVAAQAFEAHDYLQYETALGDIFEVNEPAQAIMAASMLHGFVAGTVESIVMTRMRLMRWQGLRLLGYDFAEAGAPIEVAAPPSLDAYQDEIDDVAARLDTHPFTGELAWLEDYARTLLTTMRLELTDGQ